MQSWLQNLELLIKARTPLIWIKNKEEERLYRVLESVRKRINKKRVICWDCVNGIQGSLNDEKKFSNNPLGILNWIKEQDNSLSTILLIKDFHKFYEDPTISRTVKELCFSLKETSHNIIFSSHIYPTSDELDELLTIIELPLPDQIELKSLIKNISIKTESDLDENDLHQLAMASSGLSELRVRQVAARALTQRGKISKIDLKDIIDEKKQVISRSEILEFFESDSNQNDIGGLSILKNWLKQRYQAFSNEAREYGLPLPKGVLLVGPQGTGKSLTAKAIAKSWSMPLL